MPAAVHAPLINPTNFMFKEKSGEPLVPAFTAVNGRTSPLSPRKLSGINSMAADSLQILTRSSPPEQRPQEPRASLSARDDWNPAPPANPMPLAGESVRHSVSPTVSPTSPTATNIKRKRSSSPEGSPPNLSPEKPTATRSRLDSYPPLRHDVSPPSVSSVYHLVNEHLHSRTLPLPMEPSDSERNWPSSHNAPHSRILDAQRHDSQREPAPTMYPTPHHESHVASRMDDMNAPERSVTTEMTRAGVQVDPKKRKRQFANRTKTGCGTCRRRKKKCDEAKPECNNCQRGGFICEGYANKIPWPKNGAQKPHPPLQARDRFPPEPAQLYHNHGATREAYGDHNSQPAVDGGRGRPIVVEEHSSQPPRNRWGADWSDPPRTSYTSEQQSQQPQQPQQQQQQQQPQQPQHQPPLPQQSQPPSTSNHGRPRSSDQHHSPPSQTLPPPSRQHQPRIYHHTPQTMSQVVNHSPAVTAEGSLHHPPQSLPPQPHYSHPPSIAPLTTAPIGPPPPNHHAPSASRSFRSDKEKMLSGEPFQPFSTQLIAEREKCKSAVYRFNNADNPQKDIARESRDVLFRAILAARWTLAYSEPGKSPPCGHLGREVYVDTPFMCEYGYNLSIGDNVDIGTSCKFLDSGRISIGRNSSVGANVTIDTQRTPTDCKGLKGSRRTAVAAEIHIGENVHIGSNCTILAGVRIGAGAIIHPGSVVVRDIPGNCIARGNPADYV